MSDAAIFLDKDGTLIADVPYNVDPTRIRLLPGAIAGTRALHEAGYRLVVVTNQSGIARGYFPETALVAVEETLRSLLAAEGVPLAGFFYCPHHPEGCIPAYAIDCDCRKPAPGLLLQAARDLDLDLARSWMIGDILHDVEAGHRAGCRAALIVNGGETEWLPGPHRTPNLTAPDLAAAARRILEAEGGVEPGVNGLETRRREEHKGRKGGERINRKATESTEGNKHFSLLNTLCALVIELFFPFAFFASFVSFAFPTPSAWEGSDG